MTNFRADWLWQVFTVLHISHMDGHRLNWNKLTSKQLLAATLAMLHSRFF